MYYGTKVHIDDTVFYFTEIKKQIYRKNRKFTSFYSRLYICMYKSMAGSVHFMYRLIGTNRCFSAFFVQAQSYIWPLYVQYVL